jgi:hypothetical protein
MTKYNHTHRLLAYPQQKLCQCRARFLRTQLGRHYAVAKAAENLRLQPDEGLERSLEKSMVSSSRPAWVVAKEREANAVRAAALGPHTHIHTHTHTHIDSHTYTHI